MIPPYVSSVTRNALTFPIMEQQRAQTYGTIKLHLPFCIMYMHDHYVHVSHCIPHASKNGNVHRGRYYGKLVINFPVGQCPTIFVAIYTDYHCN